MTEQQRALITLIKSALTGEAYTLTDNSALTEAFQVAVRHGVDVMAYYGALNCGIDKDSEWMRGELMRVFQSLSVSETQMAEVRRVTDVFEARGIDHMPLKGALLKSLYPKAEMRRMGDADILINCEQYETIREIMSELGYTEKYESDHELAWDKKPVHIELHKRLIPSYNKDYYSYYGDGWRLAKHTDGYSFRYGMDAEDEMIYLFTHFAKHYRDAGIGIRHLVDLWVFRNHHPELNETYISDELQKLQLLEFYDNVVWTLQVWFEDRSEDDVTDFITNVIFSSGEYGRSQASNLSSAVKSSKTEKSAEAIKRKRIFKLLFPKYADMKKKYPFLAKAPFLLPIMWLVRIFDQMFRFKKIRRFVDNKLSFSDNEVSEYQQSLNYVGLDFNFTE